MTFPVDPRLEGPGRRKAAKNISATTLPLTVNDQVLFVFSISFQNARAGRRPIVGKPDYGAPGRLSRDDIARAAGRGPCRRNLIYLAQAGKKRLPAAGRFSRAGARRGNLAIRGLPRGSNTACGTHLVDR